MEDYLKPYKWTYLKETVFTSNLSKQNSGHFRITNGILKPRHVFVFFVNNANINNQLQNSFLCNTFSVSTNPRTLTRCHLEVGNGNEYPRIHYKPTEDASRVFRDVMSYVYANIPCELDWNFLGIPRIIVRIPRILFLGIPWNS